MKKNKRIRSIVVLIISLSLITCVDEGDYSVPESIGIEENDHVNTLLDSISKGTLELKTIQQVKELYITDTHPVEIFSDIVVKGYVVSSDKTGNFYKEFYIQDAPKNPNTGIKVSINLNKSYNKFNLGREIYIRLKGLYVGEINSGDGIITIGGKIKATENTEIDYISVNQLSKHIFRTTITEEITPKKIDFASLNEANIGTFIRLENVFFEAKLTGKPYVDPSEDFDTQRKIQTCLGLGYDDLLIETSSFSSFAHQTLPEKAGTICAIVSKDYGGNFIVLNLNDISDVEMNNERCAPIPMEDFKTILLEEDFETQSGEIELPNWLNYREEGTKSWRSYTDSYSQSKAARIGSRNSTDDLTVSWLITEGVNLDTTIQEFLSFETSNSFANGSELEVFISTDFDGNKDHIKQATWTRLPAKIVSDGIPFKKWVHSTYIDISSYSGTAFIAFKYSGTGNSNFDGTYELDQIIIHGKR
jgi:hypothetical protein